jgi:hypothetical protein
MTHLLNPSQLILPRHPAFEPLLRHRLGPPVSDDTAGLGIFAGTVLSGSIMHELAVVLTAKPFGAQAFASSHRHNRLMFHGGFREI